MVSSSMPAVTFSFSGHQTFTYVAVSIDPDSGGGVNYFQIKEKTKIMKKEINCNIIREIAVLSSNQNGWQLELNEVAWNDGTPKLEFRRWAPNHEKCNRGVTLTAEEATKLLSALKKEVTT